MPGLKLGAVENSSISHSEGHQPGFTERWQSASMAASMDSVQADPVMVAPLARPVSVFSALPPAAPSPLPLDDPLLAVSLANGEPHYGPAPHGRLTPLEKKTRDKIRKREQAKRRIERLQERDNAAKLLQQAQSSSSTWHQKEREEEELILRRLERDAVFPQKTHPASAGYEFFPQVRSDGDEPLATTVSPVFRSYSHALCPVSQLPKSQLRRFGAVVGGNNSSVHHEATLIHPACHGYTMAQHDDSSRVSPVFFFAGFAKILLENVVLEADSGDENDTENEPEGGDPDRKTSVVQVLNHIERDKLHAIMEARFARSRTGNGCKLQPTPTCFVCKTATSDRGTTMGCPGCFVFSHETHRHVISSQAAQRLKTPKTRRQELEERVERHKALQKQLVMPSVYRQQQNDERLMVDSGATGRRKSEEEYYMHVLSDHQAIRKHRLIMNNFVTLHIKSLPVGNILSLRVDVKSSVAHVYELYRANVELPNRPIHLLLPTSKGLFYLNERIEDATDVRNGLVNGDFYLEDFNLLQVVGGTSTISATTRGEFMLFSVAVLNDNSTPQLLAHYLQQNFRIMPNEIADMDHLPIHHALCLLPQAVDRDLCQLRLLPHVQRMQTFGVTSKKIALAEQQQERESLLRLAFLEKKQTKLEHKRRQNQLNQANGRPSAKVRRAMAYFQYVCDSTSLATVTTANSVASSNLRLWEERLEKLWTCFQLLEEWKICKNGRLVEAETTEDTLLLLKLHQQATMDAFDQLLERKSGQGPLLYPILCLNGNGSITTRKLVVKLGVRLGPSAAEDREYGLLLDLDQDFEALEAGANLGALKDEDKQRMKKRGLTKKSLVLLAQEDEQRLASALALCADFEWKAKGSSQDASKNNSSTATLFASSDLLRPPFYQFKWTRVAMAYKQAMRAVATQVAKLEDFNSLARVLQNAEAVLSKAQIDKWQSEADRVLMTLAGPAPVALLDDSRALATTKSNFLAQAARRILVKKGAAVLKRRALQRKKQIREREAELLRLQKLQQESALPRLSLVQQLKLAFIKDKAPQIHAMLERTPAEKLRLKAAQLLDKVAAGAVSAATAMKNEYKVRAL